MIEVISTKLNPYLLPHLHIWGWEIPIYLFLGGISGGLLVITSGMLLLKPGSRENMTVKIAALAAPATLGIGMFFLFLDLAYKVHIFRFYTAMVPTSPMSWGSWALVVFFPFSILQAALVWQDWLLPRYPKMQWLCDKCKGNSKGIAFINVHLGAGVGVYTGILLATFYARPLWSNAVLGFVFMLSGMSAAAAIMLWMAPHEEKRFFSKMDMYFISLEGFATTLFIIGGLTGSQAVRDAVIYLLTGAYAPWFWSVTIFGGMIVPLLLETLESMGKIRFSPILPALIIVGSLSLRFIIVLAGQATPTFS